MRRSRPKRRFPPEVLSDAEVRALLAACSWSGVTACRNRALIVMLYRAGLRISEALALHPKDLDLEGCAVRVLYGKGGKSRTAGIDPGAAEALREWLQVRSRLPLVGHGAPLFCTARGNTITTAYVRSFLPRLGRRAGIAKRVHAHGLRHTHASQLREEGVDIGVISRQLGHSDISTTARYLDHIAPWAVVRAMAGRKWRIGSVFWGGTTPIGPHIVSSAMVARLDDV